MARRRRGGADGLTTIFWRDIPAQVTATVGGVTAKAMLEPRFQHAIDRAAAVADLTETEAYIAQWRRVTEAIEPDPDHDTAGAVDTVVEAKATDLNDRYPRPRLEELVAAGGAEPTAEDEDRNTDPTEDKDRNTDPTEDKESDR